MSISTSSAHESHCQPVASLRHPPINKPTEGIYRRLSVRMYADEKFMRLSPVQPSGQSLFIYALTGPHTGPIPGVFVAGKAAMAEALGWEPKAFEEAFAEAFGEGLIEFDAKTRLWFIPNAIKHNLPANPNVVLSWRGPWWMLPECATRDSIYERLLTSVEGVSEAFGEAFRKACGKALAKPLTKHSPKQEAGSRKQDIEKTSSSSSAEPTRKPKPTIPCPYGAIVELYHDRLPEFPRVLLRDGPAWEDRQAAMRKFWGWVLSSRKSGGNRRAETAEQAMEWIDSYFSRARDNDFLMGRVQRGQEHKDWRCDIDFLLSKKGMKQVIEKTEAAA